MCRAKRTQKRSRYSKGTHYIGESSRKATETVQPDSIETDKSNSLFTLTKHSSTQPYRIEIDINNTLTCFEIDTGASLSILSHSTYQKLNKHQTIPLEPSSIVLQTYSGESLNVLGKFTVDVKHWLQKMQLSIVMSRNPRTLH